MPYTKTTKDNEGAIAEAIGTELTYLAGISHPTKDRPKILSQGKRVTLPMLNLKANLSDLLFDSTISNKGKKFLESLGKVIAFNWYIGQGDLNTTNISVANGIWDTVCYPYDFDCGFQSIQSQTSFAKSRMNDVHYNTVDLDRCASNNEIINGALTTLRNSAVASGVDCTDFDKLFDKENINVIKRGFQEQLIKISNIEPEKMANIVERHISEKDKQILYKDYLSDKSQKAKEMSVNNIIQLLKNYVSRIEGHGFEHGFSFFASAQAKNREINCKLAKKYLAALEGGESCSFDRQSILKERDQIRVSCHGKGSNEIRSDELNDIFSLAVNMNITTTKGPQI